MTRKRQGSPADTSERPRHVEIRCGGCPHVWAEWTWRSWGGGADRGDRLGVTITVIEPGVNGSKRYQCHCGFERELRTAEVVAKTRAAALRGKKRLVAGKDV